MMKTRSAVAFLVACLLPLGGDAFANTRRHNAAAFIVRTNDLSARPLAAETTKRRQPFASTATATATAATTKLFSSISAEPRTKLGSFAAPIEEESSIANDGDLLAAPAVRFEDFDWNGAINAGLLLAIGAAVAFKLTMIDGDIMRGWSAGEVLWRLPGDAWDSYSRVLDSNPIATKAVTSATVYTIGDVIAQTTEGCELSEFNRWRIARSMLAGLIGHGPLSHYWYNLCDGLFDNYLHWTEWWSFIPKVVVDQSTWAPIWNNTYILLLGIMQLQSWKTMWSDIKSTTVPLIVSGLKIWPLAHCVTYGLVPVENRLLWVDMVEILWVTILATAAANAGAERDLDIDGEELT